VFLFHWKEESQHAALDELEFLRRTPNSRRVLRDIAVVELIELVGAVDQILQAQAAADAVYFLGARAGQFTASRAEQIARLLSRPTLAVHRVGRHAAALPGRSCSANDAPLRWSA
jgi:hypothetical protein